jgi:hypothetical protein
MSKSFEIPSSGTKKRRQAIDLLTICASVVIAVVAIQTNLVPYDAGMGDHHVILPAGLLRADSSLYLGDYFIRAAIMPHWFFEYLTTFASKIEQLNLFFFIFWLITIAVFAYANLLLAKTVMERNIHLTALLIMSAQIMGVRTMFGTSSVVLEQALPHSLAASITFLILAMWIRGDRKYLFILLPCIPVIHIQIGAIALGLIAMLVAIGWLQGNRPRLIHLALVGLTVVTTLFGLVLRPVAGNTKEFSEICKRLIPHHCYAPSWSNEKIAFCIVFVLLGLCLVLLVEDDRISKPFRLVVIGLPIAVLTFSLALDRFSDGPLTDLVRGNNIYRLAVVVVPFLYWAPLLIWRNNKRSIRSITGSILSGFLLVLLLLIPGHGSRFEATPVLLLWLMAVAIVTFWCRNLIERSIRSRFSLVLISTVMITTGALTFNERSFSSPDLQFIPNEYQRVFGEALKKSVPNGKAVAGDPINYWMRMASGVGYAVDCKFRPIGGGEPLKEFYKRLQPLGGYEEACLNYSFNAATASQLDNFAQASDAELLLLISTDARIANLLSTSWEKLDTPALDDVDYVLLTIKN